MNKKPKPAIGKKFLVGVLSFVMLFSLLPFGAAAEEDTLPGSTPASQSTSESPSTQTETTGTNTDSSSQAASSSESANIPSISQPESTSNAASETPAAIAPAEALAGIHDTFRVNLGVPAKFDTFDTYNGSPMPLLRIVVTVVTQNNAAVNGGKILLPLQSTAPDGKQYFTYDHVEIPAGIKDIVDEAGITAGTGEEAGFLVIPLKNTVPITTSADMSVYYALAPQYKSKVLPATVLWENISATLKLEGQPNGTATAPNAITTSATDDSYTDSYFLSPTDFVPGSISTLRTRAVKYNEYKINWATPQYTRRLYLPHGTQVTVAAGYTRVSTKDSANYDCYELTNSTYANNYAWGTAVDRLLDQREISFILPTKNDDNIAYEPGTQFTVIMEFEYQLAGTDAPAVRPNNRKTFTLTSLDGSNVEITAKNVHSTGGSNVPVSDIASGSVGNYNVYAISYSNYAQSTANPGTVDAKNVYGVLSQPAGVEKLNFSNLIITATRESIAYAFGSYHYSYDVKNSDGSLVTTVEGSFQPSGTGLYYWSANIAPASLPAGQYIDNITVRPVNQSAELNTLMPKNGFGLSYKMKAWDNGRWPNGTEVPATGAGVVMNSTLYYNDIQGTPKEISAKYTSYYASAPVYPIAAFVMNDAMGNSKTPGATVQYQLQLNNSLTRGSFAWKNPIIAFKAPQYLSVVSMTENGSPVSFTSLGNDNYIIQLSGAVAASYNIERKIDIVFKIADGAPAGTYKVRQVFTASANQNTNVIDSHIGAYNTVPAGESAASYGLDTSHNFIEQVNPAGVIASIATGGLTNTSYTIIPFTSVTSLSAIKTNTTGSWVKESLGVATAVGDDVSIRLTINNNGNSTASNIRLYNDITGITNDGNAKFVGLADTAGWTAYYYTGSAAPAALGTVATIPLTGANGWSTTANANAKAIMLVHTANFLPGDSLSPILKFQVLKNDVTVYNQYAYSYVVGGLTQSFTSNEYGFSTETITLNFDANTTDTTVANIPAPITSDKNAVSLLTIPTTIPTRNGFTFTGWYTDAAYTSAQINPGSSFDTHGTSATLYAKWTSLPTYTVTFKANGGTGTEKVLRSVWNSNSTLSYTVNAPTASTYTREGFTFKEWNTSANGLGTAYAPNAAITAASANIELYAIWGGTITYSKGSDIAIIGNVPTDTTVYNGNNATIANSTLSKTGYTFAGWSTTQGAASTEYTVGAAYPISHNITLYPVFTPLSYTISYELNGGTNAASNPASYTVEQAVTLANPTRGGYLFQGWTATGVTLANGTTIPQGTTGNIQLAANWLIETHSISISPAGGHTFPSQYKGYALSGINAYEVTVSTTGNSAATNLQLQLEGPDSDSFTLSKTSLNDLAGTQTDSFSVTPAANLPVGIYTANVTITGAQGISVSFALSFSVKDEVLTGKTIYLYKDQVGSMTNADYYTLGISTAYTINPNNSETPLTVNDIIIDASRVQAAAGRYIVTATSRGGNKSAEIVVLVKERTYNVTFRYNNGRSDYKTLTEAGQFITAPTDPDYVGYTFMGWFSGNTKWNFSKDAMPGHDVILDARWERTPSSEPIVPSQPSTSTITPAPVAPSAVSSSSAASSSPAASVSSSSAGSSSSAQSTALIDGGETPTGSTTDFISDQKIPLGDGITDMLGDLGFKGVWSVINMLLTLSCLAMLVVMGISTKTRKFNAYKPLLITSFVLAALTVLLFFFTSDFSRPMVLINQFTILFFLLGIIQIIVMSVYLAKNRKTSQNKQDA